MDPKVTSQPTDYLGQLLVIELLLLNVVQNFVPRALRLVSSSGHGTGKMGRDDSNSSRNMTIFASELLSPCFVDDGADNQSLGESAMTLVGRYLAE
jgi:hypothetical protein